jgi:site-specific DNA recombinase
MERPALARLLTAIEQGMIDCVVVYKVDRLSRSLADFARMMEVFQTHEVSFVSVTQAFNTTTSMGRLTLNILLSFAEFERDVISERIRDKVAAAKRKGKHTGGMPILGYDIKDRRLVINEREAKLVRHVFDRYLELGSALELARELNEQGHRTKAWTTRKGRRRGGLTLTKSHVYRLLQNRKYIGQVVHKDEVFEGEHEPIITRARWDEVQRIFTEDGKVRGNRTRADSPALLQGLIRCGHCNSAMSPTWTKRRGKVYRYYVCSLASKRGHETCPVRSIAAGVVEDAVIGELRRVFRTPDLIARTYRAARNREVAELERLEGLAQAHEAEAEIYRQQIDTSTGEPRPLSDGRRPQDALVDVERRLREARDQIDALGQDPVTERDVADALQCIDPVWDELFPAEQARVVQLLVEQVLILEAELDVHLRTPGLRSLVAELLPLADRTSEARAG